MGRYLVIAHQTASGDTLRKHVARMVAESPESEFVLVVPATAVEDLTTWTEGQAKRAAEEAGEKARQAFAVDGVHIKEVIIGDANPLYAIQDAFMDDSYDAVIVSTLRTGISRWLGMDLPGRAEKAVGVPVIHVESET